MPSPSYVPVVPTGRDVTYTGSATFVGASGDDIVLVQVDGDTEARFAIDSNGSISWGSGGAAADVSFSRYAAGGLEVVGSLRFTTGQMLFRPDGSVNLYSNAVETLHTDDSFDVGGNLRVTGNLGVGNSAAATTPGTVTNKIEVFDAAGVSLGFVPVYDAIT